MRLIDKEVLLDRIKDIKNEYSKCNTPTLYEKGLKEGRRLGYIDALHEIDRAKVKELNIEYLVRDVVNLYCEAKAHYDNLIDKERKEKGHSELAIKLLDGFADAKEMTIEYILTALKSHEDRECSKG